MYLTKNQKYNKNSTFGINVELKKCRKMCNAQQNKLNLYEYVFKENVNDTKDEGKMTSFGMRFQTKEATEQNIDSQCRTV